MRGEWVDALILLDDSEERAAEEAALPSAASAKAESEAGSQVRMQGRTVRLNALKARLASATAELDIESGRSYSALPVIHVRVKSSAALDRLAKHFKVLSIDENRASEPFLTESLPLVRQPQASGSGFRGAGTTIAVLDTGVNYALPAFGSCATPGGSCKVNYAQDFAASDGAKDANGHGTNVAAIALGVAPDAKIAALDVFSADGLAYSTDLISAINWCVANKATYNIAAINMSLGGGRYYSSVSPVDSFGVAIQAAVNAGITVVAASGNNGYKDSISWPAAYSNVVSVGAVYDSAFGGQSYGICSDATTAADKATCFSNSASFLSLLAPGANIGAAGITMAGTSQATPHVAGAVAVLRAANPSATVEQVKALLMQGTLVTDTNGIAKPRLDINSSFQSSLTVTTAVYPVAGGTINCVPNPVPVGGNSTCIANASSGYTFSTFSGDCTGAICVLNNVINAKWVTATFTPNVYAIATTANPLVGGTVSCSPNPVNAGANSTCTATANSGYSFGSFSGDCSGATCTLNNVRSAKSITATFLASSSTITDDDGASAALSGSGWRFSPAGTQSTQSGGFIPVSGRAKSPPLLVGSSCPFGLFDFVASGGVVGGTMTLTITYPGVIPSGAIYMKYGPTLADTTPHWYQYSSAIINGNKVTLTITDGQTGDGDLQNAGVISDIGGVAMQEEPQVPQWLMLLLDDNE